MAGCVIGHSVREGGAHIGYAGHLDQKLRKFERATPQGNGVSLQRARRQQLWIETANHRGTGAGGTDHGIGMLEDTEKLLRAGSGIVPVSRIEGWLTTTGLSFRKIDLVTDSS